jgi:hypothetical protein
MSFAHGQQKKNTPVHCVPKAKSSIDGAAIVAADNFLINDADGWMDGWMRSRQGERTCCEKISNIILLTLSY